MDEKENRDKKSREDEERAKERALDLRELCRVWGPFEADIVKSFLAGHGISCLIRGRMVPFVYPFTVDGLAEFKIFVEEKDFEKAKELMASMPAPENGNEPEESR
jgi:hypothetical protein